MQLLSFCVSKNSFIKKTAEQSKYKREYKRYHKTGIWESPSHIPA